LAFTKTDDYEQAGGCHGESCMLVAQITISWDCSNA